MSDRLLRFVCYRPGWTLALHVALTLFFALQLVDVPSPELRLRIETEIEKIVPVEGEYPEFRDHFRELFGAYEIVFVGIAGADVFSPEGLRRIQRLTRRIEDIDGVRRVASLSNAPGLRGESGSVRVANVYDDVPEDADGLAEIRQRVLGDPMHAGNLVALDGRAAALLVYPEEMSERRFRELGIDREIERLAREEVGDAASVLMAGNPLLKAATARIIQRDVALLLPISALFVALISWFSFRSLRGVLVPLSCIGIALVWTTGAMVLAGRSLNLITFIVPILINAVGFAYSCHLVSEHANELRAGRAGSQAAHRALKSVAFPVALTAVTTAAGFLSLCLSGLPAIREFGAFCVVGVAASLVAALSFAPPILALTARRPQPGPANHGTDRIERMAAGIAAFDLRHRRSILAIGGVVTALAILGVTQIVVSTSFVKNLKPGHPLRESSYAFDHELGGSTTFHVVVEGGSADTFKDPLRLAEIQALQGWLDEQPEVDKTTSLVDYLKVVNRAYHGGDPERFELPETKRAISQFLFFFWHDRLSDLTTRDFDSVHILARAPALNSEAINRFVDRVEARLDALPAPLVGHVTGDTVLVGRTMDEIAWGQALTLSSAILIIYVILLAYFRSFRIAFLALVPNTLPVTVYFGTLGLTGVTLNIITSLIACVILGIAVDDTIHLLVRFREKLRELGDERSAMVAAVGAVARPVTATTAALCAGLLVFGASGLKHQVEFAVLSTAMLAFAWLVDMTFTPVLCTKMGIPKQEPPETA